MPHYTIEQLEKEFDAIYRKGFFSNEDIKSIRIELLELLRHAFAAGQNSKAKEHAIEIATVKSNHDQLKTYSYAKGYEAGQNDTLERVREETFRKAIEIANKPTVFFGNGEFTEQEKDYMYEVQAQIVTNLEMALLQALTTKHEKTK